MIRGVAKPYAARVKDGSNTITTAVSQKKNIQKVIAALVCIALDFAAPSLLSGISSNGTCCLATDSRPHSFVTQSGLSKKDLSRDWVRTSTTKPMTPMK